MPRDTGLIYGAVVPVHMDTAGHIITPNIVMSYFVAQELTARHTEYHEYV